MPRLDQLPADQKAVLQLLLKQHRSYDDIAGLLRLERRAVRERALRALDALGSGTRAGLPRARQDELADYLLGQGDADRGEAARAWVAGSPAAHGWASAVAAELTPIAPGGLPELPEPAADLAPPAPASAVSAAPTAASAAAPAVAAAPVAAEAAPPTPAAAPAASAAATLPAPADPATASGAAGSPGGPGSPQGSRRDGDGGPRSSRLGGALLLALGVLALVGVGAFLLLRSDDEPRAAESAAAAPTTTAAPEGGVEAQINLRAAREGSDAVGVAQVVTAEGNRGLAVAGQNLRPGDYAIWLYTSRSEAQLLGFAPRVERNGVLQGLAQRLPADFGAFRELVVSRERVTDANRDDERTEPGTIVLRGPIGSSAAGG